MAVSQNGWTTINASQLDRSPIPGTEVVPVPGLRRGDVATVLLEVGRLFNETVAKVYNPGCWGWNKPIPIPGSTIISNHGSGTAIDLNAPSFPWTLRRMTAEQRGACRAIVRKMDGVVAWGGDFTTTVDEMHFEIIGNAAQVKALAQKIEKGGNDMISIGGLNRIYRLRLGRAPDASAKKTYVGKMTEDAVDSSVMKSKEYKDLVAAAKKGKVNITRFAPEDIRNVTPELVPEKVAKPGSAEYVEVKETLYRRKK